MSEQPPSGTLRVWIIRDIPRGQEFFQVPRLDLAKWFLLGMINCQPKEPWVLAGAYGLERFVNGRWIEWHNSQGDDIETLVEAINENLATKPGNHGVGAAGAVTALLDPTDSPV